MNILAVADEESPALWDYYVPGRLADYDLILACGDLKASYLTFLVTMGRGRLLYIHGNHDGSYESRPPEGCEDIDGHLVVYNGVRILGLGGCRWYHPGPHQYTEQQMRRRIRKLRRALKKTGGVDIVVAHAPPRGLGDMDDPAHVGFDAFIELLDAYHPQYFLHGHTHLRFNPQIPREEIYEDSHVVNVSERYTLSLPDREVPERERNVMKWISRRRDPDRFSF